MKLLYTIKAKDVGKTSLLVRRRKLLNGDSSTIFHLQDGKKVTKHDVGKNVVISDMGMFSIDEGLCDCGGQKMEESEFCKDCI